MPENVQSAMFDILKRIQSDVSDVKGRLGGIEGRLGSVATRVEGIEGRLERLETIAKKQRRDSAAMLVMMRGSVGIFDERMSDLEEDVRLLKEHS